MPRYSFVSGIRVPINIFTTRENDRCDDILTIFLSFEIKQLGA